MLSIKYDASLHRIVITGISTNLARKIKCLMARFRSIRSNVSYSINRRSNIKCVFKKFGERKIQTRSSRHWYENFKHDIFKIYTFLQLVARVLLDTKFGEKLQQTSAYSPYYDRIFKIHMFEPYTLRK